MRKKRVGIVLCLILVVSIFPIGILAQETDSSSYMRDAVSEDFSNDDSIELIDDETDFQAEIVPNPIESLQTENEEEVQIEIEESDIIQSEDSELEITDAEEDGFVLEEVNQEEDESVFLSAASLTMDEYRTKYKAFISDSRWKNGVSWAQISPKLSTYSCAGCYAYAADFAVYVYGNSKKSSIPSCPGLTKFTSVSDIRTGDIIHTSNHWFIVLERNGNTLYTAEGAYSNKVRVNTAGYQIKNGKLYQNSSTLMTFSYGYHKDLIESIPVTGVSLNKTSASLMDGQTVQLNATVSPSNATNKTVSWSSSSSAIAAVNSNGLVTAIRKGTTTITATAGGKTASCSITVDPQSTKNEVPNGYYFIETANGRDLVWTVKNANTSNSANIELDKYSYRDNQTFYFEYLDNGYYSIKCKHSGRMVDQETDLGQRNLQQYGTATDDYLGRQWALEPAGDGYYYIRCRRGHYVYNQDGIAETGNNVRCAFFNGTPSEKWKLIPYTEQEVINGTYYIEAKSANDKVLTVEDDSRDNNGNIVISNNTKKKNQQFYLEYLGNGYYSMKGVNSERYLDQETDLGEKNLQQYGTSIGDYLGRQWALEPAGGGYYYIRCHRGDYVNNQSGRDVEGNNVNCYVFNGTDAQKWKIILVADSVNPKTLKLDFSSATIPAKNGILFLQTIFTPADTTNQLVSWSSSNPEIASVNSDGKVVGNKYGNAKITAISKANPNLIATCSVKIDYSDVTKDKVSDEVYKAVCWLADNKIAASAASFGVNQSMTRGQFVRFLYRYAGNPKVSNKKNPFSDVDKDYSHYNAILWAAGEGLIDGYSDGTFRPEKALTRNNVATILWKYAGSPKVSKSAKSPFSDAKGTAIIWGATKKILTSSNGKFYPKNKCARGDFAVFLYRYNQKVK